MPSFHRMNYNNMCLYHILDNNRFRLGMNMSSLLGTNMGYVNSV